MSEEHGWATLPDLASRRAGGAVVWATDDSYAAREHLILPAAPGYQPATFGFKGQIYDGWESRRRREAGDDHALVRLGLPGVVNGVVIDTAFFTGNYPPACSVAACSVPGYPSPEELLAADWEPLLTRVAVAGDTATAFDVDSTRRYTHVRLTMHPDGGVARLRVHGVPVADPTLLDLDSIDLAALEHGGRVLACSNMFYSTPANLIAPGPARVMGEGWETARRRDDGNDWITLALAAEGVVRVAELDTTHFTGNAPGWAGLSGCAGDPADPAAWFPLLERTRLQPDTRHRFAVTAEPVSAVRLDIYPDGGMARLRLHGAMTEAGKADLWARFTAAEKG